MYKIFIMFLFFNYFIFNIEFFLPFITTQSALFKAERFSLSGPAGIIKPLPIHCFSLKQIIDKFFFIEKS